MGCTVNCWVCVCVCVTEDIKLSVTLYCPLSADSSHTDDLLLQKKIKLQELKIVWQKNLMKKSYSRSVLLLFPVFFPLARRLCFWCFWSYLNVCSWSANYYTSVFKVFACERLTCSFKAAPWLNVTLCDTSGQKQMESAHCGAFVVMCSYSWRGGKLGQTNTSVVPVCYIKLLLSQTQQKTGWTGATGFEIFSADHQRRETVLEISLIWSFYPAHKRMDVMLIQHIQQHLHHMKQRISMVPQICFILGPQKQNSPLHRSSTELHRRSFLPVTIPLYNPPVKVRGADNDHRLYLCNHFPSHYLPSGINSVIWILKNVWAVSRLHSLFFPPLLFLNMKQHTSAAITVCVSSCLFAPDIKL